MPSHGETLVTIETDAENAFDPSVDLQQDAATGRKAPRVDYRRSVVEQLYHSMLGRRFQEIRERPNSPIIFAWSSTREMVRSTDAFVRGANVKEGRLDEALELLFGEVKRVELYGFSASELQRAKKTMLRGYQQSVKERNKRNARGFASEILRHFFEGEQMPGIEVELEFVEEFLPTISLDELNGLAKSWGGSKNRVISISGPETLKVNDKPSKAKVLAAIKRAEGKKLEPWKDEVITRPLMAKKPAPGKVVKTKTIPELGVTEWRLSNGARVVIKPTDFKNDQIQPVSILAWRSLSSSE